jgi:dTDP-glucose 4,6-dehydratase
MDIRITRCGNNYGPYQFIEKLLPLVITNLISGKKIPIYGDGSNRREWIHVDDHCAGIECVIKNGRPSEIYNIGPGEELSNLEIVKQILKEFSVGVEQIEYIKDRKGHDYRYSMDSNKLASECGFIAKQTLAEGIPELVNWYQKNQKWWA